jgi:hypothetical protein
MIRRIAFIGVLAAALLVPSPASAGSGVGCSGSACSVLLSRLITLSGDVGTGAGFLPINVAPPPCLWEPIGGAVTGSSTIVSQFGALGPGAPYGVYPAVRQAGRLLRTRPVPAGTWYTLPINPAASAAGRQACLKLPLFFWAVPGQAPPAPPIPPLTLAEYAYNNMQIPQPVLTLNPAVRGYVNLGTYVWGTWPASRTTGRVDAYKIMATLGNLTVTVWAQATTFSVNVTGPGTAYSGGCGPTGSHFPVGRPPASAGAYVAPDCGVLWQAPTTGAALSATVHWVVTWGVGNLSGPGPNILPPILMTGPAPPLRVPVGEIQSVTGG